MNFKVTLLFVLFTSNLYVVKSMVHGNLASKSQFPHQVSIRYNNTHICGGTIIHKRFILTAAHCVYKIHAKQIQIIAGTTKLSAASKIIKPQHIYRGGYNNVTFSNDVALIKLQKNISFTRFIQPLELNQEHIPANTTMTVCGWGLKHAGDFLEPNILHYEQVTSISLDTCRQMLVGVSNSVITDKNICTFTPGKGVCSGDSGGPLIYNGELAGIISHGVPCAIGYPDVYMNVASYYSYIMRILKQI